MQAAQLSGAFCGLPAVTGPCRSSLPRFFFNALNRKCEPFVYGGCSSNDNNFESFEMCDAAAERACQQAP